MTGWSFILNVFQWVVTKRRSRPPGSPDDDRSSSSTSRTLRTTPRTSRTPPALHPSLPSPPLPPPTRVTSASRATGSRRSDPTASASWSRTRAGGRWSRSIQTVPSSVFHVFVFTADCLKHLLSYYLSTLLIKLELHMTVITWIWREVLTPVSASFFSFLFFLCNRSFWFLHFSLASPRWLTTEVSLLRRLMRLQIHEVFCRDSHKNKCCQRKSKLT